ncbi:MAG: tRNA (N(6)-L-threonylcarbamoyladenosine(37)-C(2))-methylthiotransferase MtaB [Thermodesulfovibrionales bacterium]
MKVAVLTLGCRVNQSESDLLAGSLQLGGATIVGLDQSPEYCIVNTCTVTAKSDYQSRQMIRRAVRAGAKVIVTGCYAELKSAEAGAIPGVLHTIRNDRKSDICRLITGIQQPKETPRVAKSRPYLKIQDGCDCRCSYCSVPLARGRSRSIDMDEALRRVQALAEAGYHEVVLTGIHLGSYGKDLSPKSSLSRLLGQILEKTSIHRVRLSSIEVNEIDEQLLELMAGPRVCRHIHMPLQSGSEAVLRLMNRNYSRERFRETALRIARLFPDIGLGTDIITGFPGEGEKEFKETVDLVREVPFTYLHVFPFSAREGTQAASMAGKVPGKLAKQRAAELISLSKTKNEMFLKAQVNKHVEAIVEEADQGGRPTGTTGNYLKVVFENDHLRKGSPVLCRVLSSSKDRLNAVALP